LEQFLWFPYGTIRDYVKHPSLCYACNSTAPIRWTRVKYEDPMARRLARLSMLALCLAAAATAEPWAFAGAPPSPPPPVSPIGHAARSTSILGSAWNADNSPIPSARLRLRNAITGRIEATTIADAAGQFTFSNIEGGTYIVELVNDGGRVLTVGHAFMVAPGETVATFVRLGARVPWFAGFFQNAAAAATSSAASLGVTALAPVAPPVSAKR
jgi:hypothetical protein